MGEVPQCPLRSMDTLGPAVVLGGGGALRERGTPLPQGGM